MKKKHQRRRSWNLCTALSWIQYGLRAPERRPQRHRLQLCILELRGSALQPASCFTENIFIYQVDQVLKNQCDIFFKNWLMNFFRLIRFFRIRSIDFARTKLINLFRLISDLFWSFCLRDCVLQLVASLLQ